MSMQKRILVVDDDRLTREMLRVILARAGYEVILAEDGLSGVEKAEAEKPDLVITDGLLPKMHGFQACKAIKAFEDPPKVILLTGVYTKPIYKWEAKMEHGADDLLIKPIKPVELLACVEQHLQADHVLAQAAASGNLQAENEERLTVFDAMLADTALKASAKAS